MRDIPISATVSFYSLLSCPRPICNLCYLPGPVGIWVCDPYPKIRARAGRGPGMSEKSNSSSSPSQTLLQTACTQTLPYIPRQQSQPQKSSPKSSGGTRHTAALRREWGKGGGSSAFEGGQCKQQVSISSVSKAPLNLTIEPVTQVN